MKTSSQVAIRQFTHRHRERPPTNTTWRIIIVTRFAATLGAESVFVHALAHVHARLYFSHRYFWGGRHLLDVDWVAWMRSSCPQVPPFHSWIVESNRKYAQLSHTRPLAIQWWILLTAERKLSLYTLITHHDRTRKVGTQPTNKIPGPIKQMKKS